MKKNRQGVQSGIQISSRPLGGGFSLKGDSEGYDEQ